MLSLISLQTRLFRIAGNIVKRNQSEWFVQAKLSRVHKRLFTHCLAAQQHFKQIFPLHMAQSTTVQPNLSLRFNAEVT